jgi:hypothetical protein
MDSGTFAEIELVNGTLDAPSWKNGNASDLAKSGWHLLVAGWQDGVRANTIKSRKLFAHERLIAYRIFHPV